MEIQVYNAQTLLPVSVDAIQKIVVCFLKREKVACDEVCIHIVDAMEISRLHEEFFQDNSLTDCITFPINNTQDKGYRPLGDVFVCPEAALAYASTHPKTDPYRELTLYIIHGL